ncbi:MAG TPA: MFS transporter [Gaiellaceae bacterium]|nr:MFS transporter [Gaiellaceae bacterium]
MWRNRSLAGLIAAELVSLTGSAMTFVALPWFVLATTGSTAKMGWVLGAELLPIGLLGVPAGSLISRLGAKRSMLISDAARGPLMLVLPVLDWTGHLSFPALLAATFAVGCFATPYYGSSRLIVPEVAGEDEQAVAQVSAVLAAATQGTQIAGPVLAGVLIAATSPPVALVVDAATYLFSFLTVATVVRAGARTEPTAESQGVLAGLRFLRRDPLLGPLLVAACAINLFAQGVIVGLDVLAYFTYGSAHVAGLLFGAFGVGALLGALAAQQLAARVELLRLISVAIVALPLPIFLLGISMPWGAALVVVAAGAFFAPLVNAPIFGVLTVRTPPALRPKVLTAAMTVGSLATPLGFFASGYALRWLSVQQLFVAIAAALTVGGLAFAAIVRRNGDAPAPASPAAA